MYLSRLPKEALQKDIFYLTPLKTYESDIPGKPWFSCIPVGRNMLDSMVKGICTDAGIQEKSNHSLRATGATGMFQSGVPERAIQARTGHKIVEALLTYERVSSTQEQSMCSVLGDVSNQPGIVSTHQTKSVIQLPTVCYNFTGCSVNPLSAVAVHVNFHWLSLSWP